MHHGLAEWLAYLSDKHLPVLKRTQKNVQNLIDQPQLSITQYAAPVLFDAGFATYIFHHVNTQRVSAGKNPLTTLDNALSHLGQAAFQVLLNKVPQFESMDMHKKNQLGYMRVMEQACHAGLQAKDWAKLRGVLQPEETQLATLLQSITELMLWCYADTAMREIEYLYYVKKKGYEESAKKVLGCGMRELGAALADKWQLPEMAIDGLNSRQDNFTLATGVSLAAELGRVVAQNWYGKLADDVIQRIARYKARPEGEISRRLHLNAVSFTEILLDKGYVAPARLIPMLAADDFIDPLFVFHKKAMSEKAAPVKENADSPPLIKQKKTDLEKSLHISANDAAVKKNQFVSKVETKVLEKNITQMRQGSSDNVADVIENQRTKEVKQPVESKTIMPVKAQEKNNSVKKQKKSPAVSRELAAAIKEFQLMVNQAKPAHDLIEKAVKICLLCGVQRCVFLIKLPNKKILVSRYSAQVRDDVAIKNLKISINNPHVFSLLMEKSRNLFLNNLNRQKYWNSIPEVVKLSIGVKQFFAISIFVNNHAMGLMYADKVKGELTQVEFSHFQGVCRLLSKGIVQSAHNKKNKS